jgi:hypothetical protein
MARSMSALGQKLTYALQQAMSALHPIATAKADIRWWIIEARVQGTLVGPAAADLNRLLVVVLDQSRPGYARLPSPARGRRHQLLIGHAVEVTSRRSMMRPHILALPIEHCAAADP